MDFLVQNTKTGICLLQDGNQEPFKVRLHLAKDILMIQEQDVICVSGEPFYSGVSSFPSAEFFLFCAFRNLPISSRLSS
uniref:Syntrophin gamma 1 n=1 Tax=Ursus americanus TaxID=9643 RepID=A0A452R6I8_URSAM